MVVEHLEPCINKWLLTEYTYVASLFTGRVWFTNVRKRIEYLERIGKVFQESCVEILRDKNVIVLDPQAEEKLNPEDLKHVQFVVIGGIMGSHPPEGRTYEFITSRMPWAKPRNLGREQLTIAGAAKVLKLVEEGRKLDEIKLVKGLRIERSLGKGIKHVVELPYAFPLRDDGSIDLPPRYIEIVVEYAALYEQRVLRSAEECVNDYGYG